MNEIFVEKMANVVNNTAITKTIKIRRKKINKSLALKL